MKLRNNPILWAAVGLVVTIGLAVGVVLALQRTGDPKAVSDNAPLIAAVIALGGVFTAQMVSIALDDRRSQQTRELEVRRARETRELEDERARKARALEAQRAGEAALQKYIEVVGELLIEKSLREASPGDNLSTVVRAQTLSVLEGLDPGRKRILLLFLYESELIHKDKRVVSLVAADLDDAHLSGVGPTAPNLSEADLSGVYLRRAKLHLANFRDAILSGADLQGADLNEAFLERAFLIRANLAYANLLAATLSDANLRGASLMGADLEDAILMGADLSDAHVTEEQLTTCWSLEGATMPNGQKYEDWLKSKGHSNGVNSGP